jgi:hypothetical protein
VPTPSALTVVLVMTVTSFDVLVGLAMRAAIVVIVVAVRRL